MGPTKAAAATAAVLSAAGITSAAATPSMSRPSAAPEAEAAPPPAPPAQPSRGPSRLRLRLFLSAAMALRALRRSALVRAINLTKKATYRGNMIMCKAMVITKGLSVSAMTGQGLVWQDHDRQMPCMSARWQAQSLPVQVAVCGSPVSREELATPSARRLTQSWFVDGSLSSPNYSAIRHEFIVSQYDFPWM